MSWWRGSEHTTFRIGGPAKFFIEARDIDELKLILSKVKKYNMPLLVIGRGSNILVSDKGVKAVVLQLNSPAFKKVRFNKNHLEAGSAITLSQILKETEERGLSGLEFLAGIPGTVGGALIMNAGIPGRNIGDLVREVKVMDYNGNIKNLKIKDIKFGYRISSLSKYIILKARFKLMKKNRQEIRNKISEYIAYRKLTQDLSRPSAGCIFKNPKGKSAGRLIDLCGLKGRSIGGASISKKHANFILNKGNARAEDVLKLMSLIKKRVKQKFDIALNPEIKIWR